jgi:hypothetical protein
MQLSISASQIAEDRKHKVCRPLADQCKSKRHVSQGLDFAQPGSSFVVEEGCGSGQRLRFVFDAKQSTSPDVYDGLAFAALPMWIYNSSKLFHTLYLCFSTVHPPCMRQNERWCDPFFATQSIYI